MKQISFVSIQQNYGKLELSLWWKKTKNVQKLVSKLTNLAQTLSFFHTKNSEKFKSQPKVSEMENSCHK